MRIKFVAPNGDVYFDGSEDTVDLSDSHRARVAVNLVGLPMPIEQTGEYIFRVETSTDSDSWEEAFSFPLMVFVQRDQVYMETTSEDLTVSLTND